MGFYFIYLTYLIRHPTFFPHLNELILEGSQKILSFRWNGPQFLDVLFGYAIKLHIHSEHSTLKDLLKRLDDSAFKGCSLLIQQTEDLADDCYYRRQRESCREFLELLFCFTPELREIFAIPKLQHFSKQNELLPSFIDFLVETLQVLLDSETDSNVPEEDQLKLLLMDLKFLLTFLGDTPLHCTELQEISNIWIDIEDIVNEAGILLHSFLFTDDRVDLALSILLPNFEILNAKIEVCCVTFSKLPTYTAQNTAVVSLFIVDSLLADLSHLLNNKADLIVDVKDQLITFHDELMSSRSFLEDIEVRQHLEMKECVKRLSNLAYEAEYIINSFVVGDVPIWYLTVRLSDFVQKNKFIKTTLSEIKLDYGVERLEVAPSLNVASFQQKIIIPVDEIIVGFKEERIRIASQLVGGPGYLQFISIIGMPGLGKTTLAKKLYNDSSVLYHFHKRSWCVISQTYQKRNILIDILSSISNLNRDTMVNMNDEMLAEYLYKNLKGRRYLIVMDDIWNINAWDDFRRYFPDDKNGSRILFTSRMKDVALEASSNGIINELPFLSKDECWDLLKQKIFEKDLCPPKLQDIGMKIARNCQGLPLAVVVIASVLSNMEEKENLWKEVARSLISYVSKDPSKDILELSYEYLPIHLKPCFLYFGAFEEDSEVPVRKLLSLWIAEGFIQKKEQKRLEDVAEEYLMDLINRSLVQVAKGRSDGGVKTCYIHDLIRDMCLRIARKENFLKVVENQFSIYEQHHRLYVNDHTDATWTRPFGLHIRSLLSYPYGIPLIPFRNLKLTRVLEKVKYMVPKGIEFLVHLRYLGIPRLSSSIETLENLEIILAEHADVIPPFLLNMTKLRHLHVRDPVRFGDNCDSSQINNLETLSFVCIFDLKDEEILRCSPNLHSLKCTCKPLSVGDGAYRHLDLNFLTQLESLKMVFQGDFKGKCTAINFPSSIKKLTLSKLGLPCEKMSLIGTLPNLEILKLECDAFEGEIWNTEDDEFQKLKFLKLDSLEIEQWNVSYDHFPILERLVLTECNKLRNIPCELGNIPTLQMIEAHSCCVTVRNSVMQIKEEQLEYYGNQELKIIISGSDS
ncbi:putative late blight resistance protein homolog R1B-16 [Olea europaea var. sylvestris]|uniref:putative late blight resistance protein homolog R1B-16 n=1 Tax=Olea europaea var. sylvestris TaxID=158386 RepID=UPI000C1D81A1|nr:putative late blight resistance protein homolog R1B-16 [Olea europaea var. sylvestris]XP_022854974.1 putative late blight resistance protein homolog R1B-16 [Olea europaea var. sylvestris]